VSGFFSFVAFCALLLLAGLAVLFHRGHKKTALLIVAALLLALYLLFRPECRAIEEADLGRFDPPIETRTEANFYGLRFFQQKTAAGSTARLGLPGSSFSSGGRSLPAQQSARLSNPRCDCVPSR